MAVKYYKDNKWTTFPGTIGPIGKSGKDAYQLAVDGGYSGTKEDFLRSLSDLINIRPDLNAAITSTNNNHNDILSLKDKIYKDIVDNCESNDANKMLSARQGKVLKSLINTIITFKVEVIKDRDLPEVGDTRTLYFKKVLKNNKIDTYDEYLYVDDAWELIGNTKIDLSNYYTKSEVVDIAKNIEDKTAEKYYNKEEIDKVITDLHPEYYYNELFKKHAYGFSIPISLGEREEPLTISRIGDPELHRTLPVQNQMKGCIYDFVNHENLGFLNPYNWDLMEDGSSNLYAGSNWVNNTTGIVEAVRIPRYWYKIETKPELNRREYWISDINLGEGWTLYPGCYCESQGVSVLNNLNYDFRNNLLSFQMGLSPKCLDTVFYHFYQGIYMLAVIEYGTIFFQKPFTEEFTTEGFHKGGLGFNREYYQSYEYSMTVPEGIYIGDGLRRYGNFTNRGKFLGVYKSIYTSSNQVKWGINSNSDKIVEYTTSDKIAIRYRGIDFIGGNDEQMETNHIQITDPNFKTGDYLQSWIQPTKSIPGDMYILSDILMFDRSVSFYLNNISDEGTLVEWDMSNGINVWVGGSRAELPNILQFEHNMGPSFVNRNTIRRYDSL